MCDSSIQIQIQIQTIQMQNTITRLLARKLTAGPVLSCLSSQLPVLPSVLLKIQKKIWTQIHTKQIHMQNAITRHPAGKSTDGFAWHIIQIQTFISIQIQIQNKFGGNPAGK